MTISSIEPNMQPAMMPPFWEVLVAVVDLVVGIVGCTANKVCTLEIVPLTAFDMLATEPLTMETRVSLLMTAFDDPAEDCK